MNYRQLVLAFSAAPEARACAQATKRERQRSFDRFLTIVGEDTNIKQIDDRDSMLRTRLYEWRDSFADRPAAGDAAIVHIALLFNWAVDRGYCRENPARGMKKLAPRVSRADKIWSPDDVYAFLSVAPKAMAELVITSLWTGLAEADLMALVADRNFDEGWLVTRRQKTKRRQPHLIVSIPYHMCRVLTLELQPLLSVRWSTGAPLFRSQFGLPWKPRNLHKTFTKTKVAAGLGDKDLHFHDLRGTFATGLLEAGCTEAEAASLTGHALAKGMLSSYAARTRALAETAYGRLVGGEYGRRFDRDLEALLVRKAGSEMDP